MLVLVAVAIASFYWITLVRGRAAWEQYERAARARGVKLMPADWAQPPLPDHENLAAAPLFREVAALGPDKPRKVFHFTGNRPPFRSNTAPFEADLERWRRYCIEQQWITPVDGEPAAAAVLRALDFAFGDDWQQLRAAVERPQCRFPLVEEDWSRGSPYLVPLLAMAQFAAFRAELHLVLADAAAAADAIHVALRLASLTREEPTMISHLVRMSAVQSGLEMIKRGIRARRWDEPALARFAADLREIRPLAQHTFALQTERAFTNATYSRLRSEGAAELMKLVALENLPVSHRLLAAYPDGWLYDSQRRANEAIDALLVRIDADTNRFDPSRSSIETELKPDSRVESVQYFLYFIFTPVFFPMEAKSLRSHTDVQCATAAIELERIRLASGSYPEALAAIGEVPLDVMDQQPLRYRRNDDDGYVLYSVGLNGQDDGGVESGGPIPASQADWVWSITAR